MDIPRTTMPYVMLDRTLKYSCPSPPFWSPEYPLTQTEISPSKLGVLIGIGEGELTVHTFVGG